MQAGENGLYERDEDLDNHNFDERSYGFSAEYSFNLNDYLELSTLGGMVFEEDAVLGLNGIGSFGLQDSSTYYMGVKAKLDLTSNVALMAAYYRGVQVDMSIIEKKEVKLGVRRDTEKATRTTAQLMTERLPCYQKATRLKMFVPSRAHLSTH